MIIEVFGVMGAGKSTLARVLAAHFNWQLHNEVLGERRCFNAWIQGNVSDLLIVQSEFYLAWLSDALPANTVDRSPRVIDHSIHAHHHIYTKALANDGKLSVHQHESLDLLYQAVRASMTHTITVFAQVDAVEIRRRLTLRGRHNDAPLHASLIEQYCNLADQWASGHSPEVIRFTSQDGQLNGNTLSIRDEWLNAFHARIQEST